MTFNQLMLTLTDNSQSYSYQMESWVRRRGFPIHTKRVDKCVWRVVYLDEFWKWAEQHRSFIDFSKLEPLALGKEPDWVPEQRKKELSGRSPCKGKILGRRTRTATKCC